jgi:amino acid permease
MTILTDDVPLVPPKRTRSLGERAFTPLTAGGVRQSMFTLISAAMGGGILCLPYAMHLAGLVPGLILLIVSCSLAFMSMRMLMLSATRTGTSSYGQLFGVATQLRSSAVILDVVTILFGQGVIIAYFVYLSDFIPPVADVLGASFLTQRWACVLLCFLAAIPFTIPRKLSALQNITPLTTLSLLITAGVVLVRSPSEIHSHSPQLEYFRVDLGIFQAFALTVSVFICHTNVVTVAEEFVNPSDRRSTKVVSRVSAVLLTVYLVLSICGYMSFGPLVEQNFIKNYSDTDMSVNLCRVLLSFSIFFGIPLNTHPTARALISSWNTVIRSPQPAMDVFGSSTSASGLSQALLDEKEDVTVENYNYNDKIRIAISVSVVLIGAIVSLFVPGIADIVGILGGSLGTLITFTFPAIIYQSVFRDKVAENRRDKLQVYSLYGGSLICFISVALKICGIV